MKTLEDRRLEFLMEGVDYYSQDTNRRSVNELGYCSYRLNGNRCFIGRHIPDDKYEPLIERAGVCMIANQGYLPDNIVDLGLNFLSKCQSLHDDGDNWCDTGLSLNGYQELVGIINAYCTNDN